MPSEEKISPDVEQLNWNFWFRFRMWFMHWLMQREGQVDLLSLRDGEGTQGELDFILKVTRVIKFRKSRLLAPTDSPLKILNKLGEYSGEVRDENFN